MGFYYGECKGCTATIRKDEHDPYHYCFACFEWYDEPGGAELDQEERPPSTIPNHPSDYDGE